MKHIKIVFALIIWASIPYYKTIIFDFQESDPFSGTTFYNPYDKITESWLKANFHAHTKMYNGIANGKNQPEEMYRRYDSLNYDLACISNYHNILPNRYNRQLYIPTYEHGRNFGKIHQLVLNSKYVNNYDFLFYQNINHKQAVINNQKECGQLIILAHPSLQNGLSKKDLRVLNNYDLFEGISEKACSIELWDEALSNGHAVWITGSDDAHDISDAHTGICWTMINTTDTTEEDIIKALIRGASYAQEGWQGQELSRILSISVNKGFYMLELENKVDSIILKSDFGKTVAATTNACHIKYKIKPENSYVRAEIFETKTRNTYTKIYLNPVIRTENSQFTKHNNQNAKNTLKTWLVRLALFLINLPMLMLIIKTPIYRFIIGIKIFRAKLARIKRHKEIQNLSVIVFTMQFFRNYFRSLRGNDFMNSIRQSYKK